MTARTIHRAALMTAGALIISLVAGVSGARASSLVYISDGNVWLANPDGSGARQVTTGGGYSAPSQADDGTIVALNGSALMRMDRGGRVLPGPGVPVTPGGTGPLDPRISADGTKVAFHWVTFACDFCGGNLRTGTQITWADHATPAEEFGWQRPDHNPSWISNSRLLLFDVGADVVDLGAGPDTAHPWFTDSEYIPIRDEDIYYEGEVTRAGDKIALGGGLTGANKPSARIRLFSANGPYPAKPTARCNLNGPTDAFQNLTWSPDGSQLAFEDADGIWVMPVNLDDCSSLRPTLAVPDGHDPDWGPAEVGTVTADPPPCSGSQCRGKSLPNRLSGLTITPKRFRAARNGPSMAAATGAHVRYRLSQAATVRFRVERRAAGRRVGRRCLPLRPRARRGARCDRYTVLPGALAHRGRQGLNSFRFRGRLAGRSLRPGAYRLVARPRGADRTASRYARFEVAR